MADKPAAEVAIDEVLVRSLLRAQAPAFADRPLERIAEGWDNEIWMLGSSHTVRLPRRALAAQLVENEQRWLAELAPRLPIAVPAPVIAGRPTAAYPWAWSVVEWFPGEALAERPGTDSMARDLGAFLAALHVAAPAEAPPNQTRGVALQTRAEVTERWFTLAGPMLDRDTHHQLRTAWSIALAQPVWSAAPVWLHGDLHPMNIVVEGERLAAVIDFGDITSGDPASDLAVAWMAFEPAQRRVLRESLPGVDTETWARAHGWAVALGVTILANSDDAPAMERVARTIIRRSLDDVPV